MAVKNLVSGVLAQSITTSTTNILVNIAKNVDASAIQSFFPTPPFYITIMPKAPAVGVANRLDSEILQVTAVGSDQSGDASLTCVRGQRDTTAKAFDVGSIVTVGVYADDAVFLGSEGSAVENPAPWVESSDIKNGAVTTDKIADGAVKSNKINWETMKYKTGDVISTGDASETHGQASFVITAGHITSSQTEIGFNIPISKSAKGLSLSFSSDSKIWIRVPTGGYLINNANISSYKTTVVGYDNFIGVMLKNKDNSAFNATNNIPLAIGLNARINVN